MAEELFSIDHSASITRQLIRNQGVLVLDEFPVAAYEIREGYLAERHFFTPDGYKDEIRLAMDPAITEAVAAGFPASVQTAIYEALLNAFQHGNKFSPQKPVTMAYKVASTSLEVGVMDEGGVLDPEFLPFVLSHRQRERSYIDFYDFAGRPKPETNLGTGTSFMHLYMDAVEYFKSPTGGLVVHLTKRRS